MRLHVTQARGDCYLEVLVNCGVRKIYLEQPILMADSSWDSVSGPQVHSGFFQINIGFKNYVYTESPKSRVTGDSCMVIQRDPRSKSQLTAAIDPRYLDQMVATKGTYRVGPVPESAPSTTTKNLTFPESTGCSSLTRGSEPPHDLA